MDDMAGNTIATITDDKFFPYALALINSILENYPEYPGILVLYDGLNEEQVSLLKSIERIKPKQVEIPKGTFGPVSQRMSKMSYAKYLYFIDREYDKILHIDPDALVLKPLDTLFNRNEFFAVECLNTSTLKYFDSRLTRIRLALMMTVDGLRQKAKYIMNAGILLIPKRYRTRENYEYLVHLTRRYYSFLKHWDQTPINMWMWKNGIVPSGETEFNYQSRFHLMEGRKRNLEEIYIIHFVGDDKPDSEIFRKNNPAEITDLYDRYAPKETYS